MIENEYRSRIAKECSKVGLQFFCIDTDATISGKKPFDGIFINNKGQTIAVEFKVNYRILEDHQLLSLKNFNGLAITVRIMKKQKVVHIEVHTPGISYATSIVLSYARIVLEIKNIFEQYKKGRFKNGA